MNVKQKLKRMESRLQSNEVRIPKSLTTSLTSTASGSYSACSVVASNIKQFNNSTNTLNSILQNSNHNQNHSNNGFLELDLNAPCQYFKSSFARSLSLGNNNHETKSLDFGINFALSSSMNSGSCNSSITEEQQPQTLTDDFQQQQQQQQQMLPPPLPLSKPPSQFHSSLSYCNSNNHHGNFISSNCDKSEHNSSTKTINNRSTGTNNNRNVWSTAAPKQNCNRHSLDSSEIEVMRLRKECQNLVEENRRLMNFASGIVDGKQMIVMPPSSQPTTTVGNAANIEAVILKTQVETLQWQLKQVEGSREMYRAVMEEVVRFLERCHRNLDSIQNQQYQHDQIIRSKSTHHVYPNSDINLDLKSNSNAANKNNSGGSGGSGGGGNVISPRARSSTNLIDVQKNYTKLSSKSNENEFTKNSPAISYNNFRDFTWRRSPKRGGGTLSNLKSSDSDPEKLSQEAFRLLRTAQNLLNTQEPDLAAQSKITANDPQPFLMPNIVAGTSTNNSNVNNTQPSAAAAAAAAVVPKLSTAKQPISATVSITTQQPSLKSIPSTCTALNNLDTDPFSMSFSRKINMRESRLSLRSSTDSSVHSTSSSSKNETDEENNMAPPPIINNKDSTICSSTTTEDESGFSSISSFQEIGLPLHSTMISGGSGSGSSSISCSSSSSSSGGGNAGTSGRIRNTNGHHLLLHNSTLISNDSAELITNTIFMESRNSTLKAASQTSLLANGSTTSSNSAGSGNTSNINCSNNSGRVAATLGLPVVVNHRRWDSAPIVPPRANFHRFSTVSSNGDDGPAVLWV